MKLLWVVQRFGPEVLGGSEVAGREFAQQMVERGHEVTILTSCATSYSDWANQYPSGESWMDGIRIVRLPVHAPRDNAQFGPVHAQVLSPEQPMLSQQQRWSRLIGPDMVGFAQWIRTNSQLFDVGIFKAYLYSTATRGIPAAFGRMPILFNPEAHPEEMLNISLHESIFRLADAFQFHSREEAELVCRRLGYIPPHEVVGIGVKPEQFQPGGTDVLRRLNLESQRYAVVVGRVDVGKGSFEALTFFKQYLRNSTTDLKLVLVGERADLPDLGDRIVATGFVSEAEKRDLIGGALCLIQPSYLESFSIVLTEAWALSRPVIVQGKSDVLRGQTARAGGGLVYTDYESFVAVLNQFDFHPENATRMGSSGNDFVRSEYSWSAVMTRFERAVTMAIDSHSRRHRRQ